MESTSAVSRVMVLGPIAALLSVPSFHASSFSSVLLACAVIVVLGIAGSKARLPFVSHVSAIVIDRTVNARKNWENDTLRSFVEAACWINLTMQLFAISGDAWFSASVGGCMGFGMVAVGEAMTTFLRRLEQGYATRGAAKSEYAEWKQGSFFSFETLCFTFFVGLAILAKALVHPQFSPVARGFIATVVASTCLVTVGQLMMFWSPTHLFGCVVHNRLVKFAYNWRRHTLRSAFEFSIYLGAVWQCFVLTNDLAISAAVGSVVGLTASIIGETCITDQFVSTLGHRQNKANGERLETTKDSKNLVWREELGVSVLAPRIPPRVAQMQAEKKKTVTTAQVAKHNTKDDLWVIVDGHAYDLTSFVARHPGGHLPLINMAGKDATDAMNEFHPARVFENMMPKFHVGKVSDYTVSKLSQGCRDIRQELLRQKLFETSYSYYVMKVITLSALFIASVVGPVAFSYTSTLAYVVSAAGLGLFWQQLAFIGHDMGHNSISHDLKTDNYWAVLFGNTLGGISLAWWKRSHNTHHVTCNSIEHDPDIQHLPIFAVSDKLFNTFWSTYYEKYFKFDGIARTLVSYQHILFYPVMAFARFNLYAQGWLLLLSKKRNEVALRKLEISTLCGFLLWNFALYYALPSWNIRLLYLFVSHAVAGVLHVQICLSHFSMENYHGHGYSDESDEWFMLQLKTTMDVDCPVWMDWFHGGLQFQIEHHLFPRLPRHNLRIAQKLVKELCAKNGVHHHNPTFFTANKELVGCLRNTAMKARQVEKGDGGFYQAALWDGLNLNG